MNQVVDLLKVRPDEDVNALQLLDAIGLSIEYAASTIAGASVILLEHSNGNETVNPRALSSMLAGVSTHLANIQLLANKAYENSKERNQ